jgi:hypothetical protein
VVEDRLLRDFGGGRDLGDGDAVEPTLGEQPAGGGGDGLPSGALLAGAEAFGLSGALYPVGGLPAWLEVLTRVNPLTYAVDTMRHLVFDHLDVSEAARQTLDPGVTWWGWHLPPVFEAGMVLLLALVMMGVAIRRFSRTE